MENQEEIFNNILRSADAPGGETKISFKKRIDENYFSKSQNPFSHFCVYFPAYDPANKLVYIGRHKKSGLWLFNGGHMEQNELPLDTLKRKIREEWGIDIQIKNDLKPVLVTITQIASNPAKRSCKIHYEFWFFIPQDSKTFQPDKKLSENEFYETGWKTFDDARALSKDPNTIIGINKIEGLVKELTI